MAMPHIYLHFLISRHLVAKVAPFAIFSPLYLLRRESFIEKKFSTQFPRRYTCCSTAKPADHEKKVILIRTATEGSSFIDYSHSR